MFEGLYRIRYQTPLGEAGGVCMFQKGQMVGGGQVLYIVGTYEVHGTHFTGEMVARKHAKVRDLSPVLGLEDFHMRLEGTVTDTYGQLAGTILERPDIPPLNGSIMRICAV